jgi:hypothetical protein
MKTVAVPDYFAAPCKAFSHALVLCWLMLAGVRQNPEPGCFRNSISSSVDFMPRMLFLCG